MILSISCISASEIDNNSLSTSDNKKDNINSKSTYSEHSSSHNSIKHSSLISHDKKSKSNSINYSTSAESYSLQSKSKPSNTIADFDELSSKINATPKGKVLILNRNYKFVNSSNVSNKGILISKSITIDGKGHTINANKISRIFNITANNVILKNINFINGNRFGRYDNYDIGGGAIYWYGNNGKLLNCNFINNTGLGIEDDPYDKEEIITNENGTKIYMIRMRPMGALTNEGGAIVWRGCSGIVSNCTFKDNGVGYPNHGGAIDWKGNNGKIINSLFCNNAAWTGGAIYWSGNNGKILSSTFLNNGMFSRDIFWTGKNGLIKKSILLNSEHMPVVSVYDGSLNANSNFWGDTFSNPNMTIKTDNISNWYILNKNTTKPKLIKGDKLLVDFDDFLLITKNGNVYNNKKEFITKINLNPKTKIVSKNLTTYYKSSKQFKVLVYDDIGKLAINKEITFKINKQVYHVKTNKNGIASLKINQKPGKYNILVQYKKIKVKSKITVKTTLITKNVTKKIKKTKYFKIKVLDSKGKPYNKQVLKLKFKGKTYELKTNKNGIAIFTLSKNLKIGKYVIKTSYNGLTNTNEVRVIV